MKTRANCGGFSLIEVSIALLIIGIIIGPLIGEYAAWKNQQRIDLTTSNDGIVREALRRYAQNNGCYPLPAIPSVSSSNASAGVEDVPLGGRTDCTALSAAQLAAIPVCTPPVAGMGVCQTPCLTTGATTTCTGGIPAIIIGDVPFATLGLPKQYITDGFGNKFTYAVSFNQTGASTFDNDKGAVQVGDLLGHSGANGGTLNPQTNAHYAIISHGRDGLGGFTLEGGLIGNCPGAGTTMDAENCNNDGYFDNGYGVYTTTQGVQYGRQESTAAGANHFDDFVNYDVSLNSDIWTKSVGSNILSNNGTGYVLMQQPNSIGVGAANPQAKIDVRGDVSADKLYTNSLCDTSGNSFNAGTGIYTNAPCKTDNTVGTNGFNTNILTTTPASKVAATGDGVIHCGAGTTAGLPAGVGYAMSGIAVSNEECADTSTIQEVDTGGTAYNISACPSGEYPTGVYAGGAFKCHTPPAP